MTAKAVVSKISVWVMSGGLIALVILTLIGFIRNFKELWPILAIFAGFAVFVISIMELTTNENFARKMGHAFFVFAKCFTISFSIATIVAFGVTAAGQVISGNHMEALSLAAVTALLLGMFGWVTVNAK